MASKTTEAFEFLENNLQYVQRLLYDVLVYTLPICGFTETTLLTTDCEENAYKFSNFIEAVGAVVLTRSLASRNVWAKPMWLAMLSQEDNCGIDYEYVKLVLTRIFLSFRKKGVTVTKNFVVEMSLAFCNEILLFVHHEGKDIDFKKLIKSVGNFIVNEIAPNHNVSEIIAELFPEFHNSSLYTKWITDFITKFAVPYGCRDDVPELIRQHYKELEKVAFKVPTFPDSQLVKKLQNPEGFLPNQLFTDIAAEESEPFQASSVSESRFTDGDESPNLPESSEGDSLGDKKSYEKLSIQPSNVLDQSAESGKSSKDSSELGIGDDLGQMSLQVKGTYQESYGVISKRKMPELE